VICMTARALLQRLASGEIRATELLETYLATLSRREPEVRAFLHWDEAAARRQAQAIDRRRAAGEPVGPLAGVPIALKDNLATRDMPTTCGSRILKDYRSPFDAHVVERLRAADAVILGKTNMDEFAMGSSTENSAYGPTRNPHDLARVPGGSSGGSAAAVAADMVPLALGSDTGGSVRQPAALCGVVGLKPSYGRVSRYGLIAYGSSLDVVGIFSQDVADAAFVLNVIAGPDPRDGTAVPTSPDDYLATLDEPIANLRIGVPREYFAEGLDSEVADAVRAALGVYEKLGATLVDISLPHTRYALAVYYLVATAEACSNLARYDGVHYGQRQPAANLAELYSASRGAGLGAEVKRRIMLGTHALSSGYRDAYYVNALRARRLIRNDYIKAFQQCDVLAGPTSPTTAFPLNDRLNDPLAMYLADIYTIGANLAGLPAVSMPCGQGKSGLPIGLQLQAPALAEARLLQICRMGERAGIAVAPKG
jgi:aspartyl-tRNA(Asn)/glutamyl-tRNA(Gln) amidotransferase subunit A